MAVESSPRLSLVIPAFNERECLPRLLDSVDEARGRYRHGPDRVQVIVADNASTDGTGLLAADRGCLVARVERRAIAAARNGGARLARGELLAFVDADMRIHPQTFDAIDAALQSPRVVGGATGVRLERWSLGVAATYALLIPGIWATGLDTGVVFCRRRDFEAIGGYREEMLCAEDVQFLLALRRRGKAAGQRLTRLRRVKALASMRKFDQFGEWHYFRMVAHAARCGLRGRAMSGFARRYWYDVRGG